MLDLKHLRQDPDGTKNLLARRGPGHAEKLDEILELDRRLREVQTRRDELAHRQNLASKEIGARQKAKEDASAAIASVRDLKAQNKELEEQLAGLEATLREKMAWVPNLPHPEAPVGDETAGRVVRTWGEPKPLAFPARPHWELGEELSLFALERGSKLAGSGFILFTGLGARLERALINFMLDFHTSRHGYTEVWPPALATREVMFGTGQVPKLEGDMYRLERDDLFLIPTAEVQLTNIHRGELVPEKRLPIYYTAFTHCFRREAGAAGKDTRGLIRVHQFDKVELVKLVVPETSEAELLQLVREAQAVLEALGLAYRVVELATGDLGFASRRTYDLELWAPGVDKWLEVSSCSNCGDFQARRADLRYRPADGGKPRFLHTLNGSGVALPRLVIALLENGQQPDGTVELPPAIRPYLGGLERIGKV